MSNPIDGNIVIERKSNTMKVTNDPSIIPQKELQPLIRWFLKLATGETKTIPIRYSINIEVPVNFVWEEDMHTSYSYNKGMIDRTLQDRTSQNAWQDLETNIQAILDVKNEEIQQWNQQFEDLCSKYSVKSDDAMKIMHQADNDRRNKSAKQKEAAREKIKKKIHDLEIKLRSL